MPTCTQITFAGGQRDRRLACSCKICCGHSIILAGQAACFCAGKTDINIASHFCPTYQVCPGDSDILTMLWSSATFALSVLSTTAFACESCEHPERDVVLTRNVRRMQPDAITTTTQPKAPLAWGQLNFMHTTDTHGWLVLLPRPTPTL